MFTNNKRAWIYCRVAHPDAHALAAQQASLEAYAEAHGFKVVGTTAEQASGLDFSRRGLAEVSGAVADGKIDLLLVEDTANPVLIGGFCRIGKSNIHGISPQFYTD